MNLHPDEPESSAVRSALRRWLSLECFPLWNDAGWDAATGQFIERLDMAGRPLADVPRRLMVQARQICAFSVAARRGWSRTSGARLERAADSMMRLYYGRDGSGWAFSVDRSGRIVDPRRDLYSFTFALLALADITSTCGDRRARARADETLAFMDRHMAHATAGYVDSLPLRADGLLRQNPHMHLLEALLAWHEAAPEGDYIDRARDLVTLLSTHLLQGRPPVLAEYFDNGWKPRTADDVPFEPGHHFEWVWLLSRYANLSRRALPDAAASLWAAAIDAGLGPGGIIYDEVSLRRGALRRSTRLWPYCEAAKAACHSPTPGPTADSFLQSMQERFLAPAYPGSWIDHVDPNGDPKSSFAPASSLYHICCAADRVIDRG